MPERQVSLQDLESKLDSYTHDVENGATVVMNRDGRQVARLIHLSQLQCQPSVVGLRTWGGAFSVTTRGVIG